MNKTGNFGTREHCDTGTRFAQGRKTLRLHHLYLLNNYNYISVHQRLARSWWKGNQLLRRITHESNESLGTTVPRSYDSAGTDQSHIWRRRRTHGHGVELDALGPGRGHLRDRK